jgi:hypothetical protein
MSRLNSHDDVCAAIRPIRIAVASGRARVHRLLGCAQGDTTLLQLMHDVLQVLHGPGEPVDAGDDQGIAGLHEVEQRLQLGPAVTPAAAGRLGADHAAAGRFEGGVLNGEVLVEGADAGVAVDGHRLGQSVPFGFRPAQAIVSEC